jgi:hypothetical protein
LKPINNINQILDNVDTLEKYLSYKKEPEYEFALNLIKRGTCFLAIKSYEGYKFYPSRFIGYVNNNMAKHLNNDYKDGRETNVAISNIVGFKPKQNPTLNLEYTKYCERLGFIANDRGTFGVERKFWEIN